MKFWPKKGKDWKAHAQANRAAREALLAAGWVETPILEVPIGKTFIIQVGEDTLYTLQSEWEHVEVNGAPRLAATVDSFSSLTGTLHRERADYFSPRLMVWVQPSA